MNDYLKTYRAEPLRQLEERGEKIGKDRRENSTEHCKNLFTCSTCSQTCPRARSLARNSKNPFMRLSGLRLLRNATKREKS
jgi:hypothetical protein